uniref:Rho-GAP domain-containing protein n=1 Tax=Molossus molossus TaxID=27622 RepID=A0A7J8I1A1_MOLMO|nr:hypothetical protein HJG59_010847 [Molossus molossus]
MRSPKTSLRRDPGTSQGNHVATPPSTKPKQLFRASLEELREGDALPGPLLNIPGSIFSRSAYDQWLGVMDKETEEEKIALSQRLLEQLPRANAGLLRHLFGLLHTIQQHCSSNQMTARSLGSCPAPGIFCLPSACRSDLVRDLRTKVMRALTLMP